MRGYIYIPSSNSEYEKRGKELAGSNGIFDTLFIAEDVMAGSVLPAKESSDNHCIFVGPFDWSNVKTILIAHGGWGMDDFINDDITTKQPEEPKK